MKDMCRYGRFRADDRQVSGRCRTGVGQMMDRCVSVTVTSDLVFLWQQFDQLFQDLHIKLGPISSLDQRHEVLMGAAGETDRLDRLDR